MSSPPQQEIRDVLNAQEAASRNFEQAFQFANRTVTHSHHLQVEFTEGKSQRIEILNHFASAKEEKITKLTEIHFQNRIIKIIDTFSYDNNRLPHNIQDKVEQSEVAVRHTNNRQNLLRKKYKVTREMSEGEELRVRDTKNVVKNIIRLFQSWVELHSSNKSQIQELLSTLVFRNKYNNRLILEMSKDELLRKSFIAFSQNAGEQSINKSKINDKDSHLEALKRYRRICCDQEYRIPTKTVRKAEQQEQEMKQQQLV